MYNGLGYLRPDQLPPGVNSEILSLPQRADMAALERQFNELVALGRQALANVPPGYPIPAVSDADAFEWAAKRFGPSSVWFGAAYSGPPGTHWDASAGAWVADALPGAGILAPVELAQAPAAVPANQNSGSVIYYNVRGAPYAGEDTSYWQSGGQWYEGDRSGAVRQISGPPWAQAVTLLPGEDIGAPAGPMNDNGSGAAANLAVGRPATGAPQQVTYYNAKGGAYAGEDVSYWQTSDGQWWMGLKDGTIEKILAPPFAQKQGIGGMLPWLIGGAALFFLLRK